jgi:hypothetical protein
MQRRSEPSSRSAQQSQSALVVASPWGFALLRSAQALVLSVLWLSMAFVALNAFVVLIGGIFFWEYADMPDLTAPQAAGGGILTAAVLVLVFLGLRRLYRMAKGTRILRGGAAEMAAE